MNKGPKISIITACYNAEKTIEQTIQSVINQTYNNIEYIIIDGASTDGTMEIVNKYSQYISKVISEPDKGIYDAFNKGILNTTGKFINFMNADDFFSTNDIVGEVAAYLQSNEQILMVHGDVKAIDESSGHWHYRGEPLTTIDLKNGKMCPHQSVFVHKKLFDKMGGFDLRYKILADIDFTIKCFINHEKQIEYLPLEIANFRLGGVSTNINHEKNLHVENAIIHLHHFQYTPEYTQKYMENQDKSYNDQHYHMWLESFLTGNNGVLSKLKDKVISNAIIFGTKKNATFLFHNLRLGNIEIDYFLDNDKRMQGKVLHEKPIISPMNLDSLVSTTIIISIERKAVADEIKAKLTHDFPNSSVYTWHELI